MYCIRKSSGGGDRPYTLAVFYENKVYNLPVRRRADRKYALGAEKRGEHVSCVVLLLYIESMTYIPVNGV